MHRTKVDHFYAHCVSIQIPSGYYLQAMNSNLHLSDVLLPIGTMNVISILPLLMLAPLIECVNSCSLSMAKTPLAPYKTTKTVKHIRSFYLFLYFYVHEFNIMIRQKCHRQATEKWRM